MTQEQLDKLDYIKTIGMILSVVDNTATLPAEAINRIGDLIQDLTTDIYID